MYGRAPAYNKPAFAEARESRAGAERGPSAAHRSRRDNGPRGNRAAPRAYPPRRGSWHDAGARPARRATWRTSG